MAVESFNEIAPGRGGSSELKGESCVTRYTRVWLVRTTKNTDDETVVLAHASCPSVGDAHPNDAGAFCTGVFPNQHKGKVVWRVTAKYSDEFELSDNPLNDPARIEWSTEPRQKVFWKDRDGNAILNSAGDYYDPPVEGDDSRWVVTISKNLAAVPSWVLTYRDAVSSDNITIDGVSITAGYAKMMRIRISDWQERNDVSYRVVTFTIAISNTGWAAEILDQGFRELDSCETSCGSAASSSGSGICGTGRRHILDSNCDPVVSPVPLDGSGCAIACPTPSTAVFRTHHIYTQKAFSSLPLS